MDETQFWALIDAARAEAGGDDDTLIEALHVALFQLDADQILGFQRRFGELHERSYTAALWGAAHLINGGCSDDGFDYFRGWLISRGRAVFEAALADPDSLATVAAVAADERDYLELEAMLSVALDAWMDKTSADMDAFYDALGDPGTLPELGAFEWDDGQGDMDEAAGQRLYPRLWAISEP